jgi:hypothetical protein
MYNSPKQKGVALKKWPLNANDVRLFKMIPQKDNIRRWPPPNPELLLEYSMKRKTLEQNMLCKLCTQKTNIDN